MTGTAVSPGSGSSNGGLPTGTAAIDKGCWTVGLMNSKFKYLSAETFGFRINANGKALMKKQVRYLFYDMKESVPGTLNSAIVSGYK
jgi:hypothetical protein